MERELGRGEERAHPEVDQEAQHVLRRDAGARAPLPSRPLPRSDVGKPARLQLLLETEYAETPATELPMGRATLDVDNRQPRWADELGENDLADDEPEEGSEEKGFDFDEEGPRRINNVDLPRPGDDCELSNGQAPDETTTAAGDRFTFAVRAVILLIRCRGAMLASGTRPLFAWAVSAALFRHRCPCDTAARFEQLLSGSTI